VAVFAAGVFAVVPASERLAKGKVFLQKKINIAKKVDVAKAQLLATRKRVQLRTEAEDQAEDPTDASDAPTDAHAAPTDAHAADAGAHSADDPVTQTVQSAVYSDSEDPTGLQNELLSLIIARGTSSHAPTVTITDSASARGIVSSVIDHCYTNDGSSRVYLNLEGAESSFFGSCKLSGKMGTCKYTSTDPFGSASNDCLPDPDTGCGNVGSVLVPLPGQQKAQGSSLCTCAVAGVDLCRCVYELSHDQASAFCVNDKAPKHFTVIS